MVPATQLKANNVILLEDELYRVISLKHVQQKRRALITAKLKAVSNGASLEHRFRSSDRVELAMLDTREAEYLYNTGAAYIFMDTETYEQIPLDEEILGNALSYLTPNERLSIQYHDKTPVGVELPIFVELEIAETDPPLKGATATGSPKSATLETGLLVRVPQFLQAGEKIRIDTRDDSFVERVET